MSAEGNEALKAKLGDELDKDGDRKVAMLKNVEALRDRLAQVHAALVEAKAGGADVDDGLLDELNALLQTWNEESNRVLAESQSLTDQALAEFTV